MADVLVESVQAVSESNDDAAADPASSQVQQPTVTTSPHATPGAPQTLSTHLSTRLDRTTICLPIVHGSVSFYLGKKAENKNEFQSHQWTLYLRGSNNEDLSHCIEKVVFQLHPSFAQPIREYTQPPYEVTEKGWGEFEAQIRIYWKDPSETMTMVSDLFSLLTQPLIMVGYFNKILYRMGGSIENHAYCQFICFSMFYDFLGDTRYQIISTGSSGQCRPYQHRRTGGFGSIRRDCIHEPRRILLSRFTSHW